MPRKNTSLAESVGERLELLRVNGLGIETIREFANQLGVKEDRYDSWEKGRTLIPVSYASDLSRKYGIALDWLYQGKNIGIQPEMLQKLRNPG